MKSFSEQATDYWDTDRLSAPNPSVSLSFVTLPAGNRTSFRPDSAWRRRMRRKIHSTSYPH